MGRGGPPWSGGECLLSGNSTPGCMCVCVCVCGTCMCVCMCVCECLCTCACVCAYVCVKSPSHTDTAFPDSVLHIQSHFDNSE